MARSRDWVSNLPITAPSVEPLTLAQAKAHLRITTDDPTEEATIAASIVAARDYIERLANRPLIKRQFRMKRMGFPAGREFALPSVPALSLVSIAYLDESGASQSLDLASVVLDSDPIPGVVRLAHGAEWPSTLDELQGIPAVTVTYWAGSEDADSVPASLVHALKLALGHFFDGAREAAGEKPLIEHEHSIRALVAPYLVASVE